MTHDPTRTRELLLDAATREFTAFGLAGARVDRIAAAAGVNKQGIYGHFGSKEALFDAVLDRTLEELAQAVPILEYDLSGYALALFDYLCAHPEYERLSMWRRLERADSTQEEVDHYERKLAQFEGPRAAGYAPINLLLLILGMAHSWANLSPSLRALDAAAPGVAEEQSRHRAALELAARAVVQELGSSIRSH